MAHDHGFSGKVTSFCFSFVLKLEFYQTLSLRYTNKHEIRKIRLEKKNREKPFA